MRLSLERRAWSAVHARVGASFALLLVACSAGAPDSADSVDLGATGGTMDASLTGGAAATGGGSSGGAPSGSGGSMMGTGGSGGSSTGGSQGISCVPGGSGYDMHDGFVISKANCVFYQVPAALPERLPHLDAIAFCEALSLGGYDDWRLPSVTELSAIVVTGVQPSVDAAVFPNTDSAMYLTSMTQNGKVTALDFYNDGMVNNNIGPDGAQAYRCVRADL